MQANSRHYAKRNVQYAGGFKGFKGFSGNSGGRKPFIWYKGYKYTWNETYSDYCCIFKPKGGGEPVVKKYKEEKLKDDLAAAKAAQEAAKAAEEAKKKAQEEPKEEPKAEEEKQEEEAKEEPKVEPANGSESVAKTPIGEPVVSRRLFVLKKAANKLYNLELPDDVDAAKKVALDALKIAEVAVKQQRVTEYDLLGAIASARDQINAAQDSEKTGIGKSNIENALSQLSGKFNACANIIERNAAQNKEEEPQKEEPKVEAEPAKESSPYANMKPSEIIGSISDDMSVSEKDERLKAWAEKYFATSESDPTIVKECENNKEWFSSDKIPVYIRMQRVQDMVRGRDVESIDEGATAHENWAVELWNKNHTKPAEDWTHQYYRNVEYMWNKKFREGYEESSSRSFDEIVSNSYFNLGGKVISYEPSSRYSNKHISPQFSEAFNIASRDKLIEIVRNLPFRDGMNAEKINQAKEVINRCLAAASLPTTTDYEAKGLATAIQRSLADEYDWYEEPYYSDPYTDKPFEEKKWSLSDFILNYVPETTLKELEERSYGSGASNGKETPETVSQEGTKGKPKSENPVKRKPTPEPEPETGTSILDGVGPRISSTPTQNGSNGVKTKPTPAPTAEPPQPEEKPLPPMSQTSRGSAKPEQPQPEQPQPEPPQQEPAPQSGAKDARSSAYDHMYASEIFKSISDTASEAEKQRAYAAWSNKFFATTSENEKDVERCNQFKQFFNDATIPAFVKRSVLDGVQGLDVFKTNGYSFEKCDNIDQIVNPKTGERLHLRNWLFSRAGGHYKTYYQQSFDNIPAPEVPYRTRERRYYKIWSLGGAGLESIGCLMKEGSAFRDAFDSSREDLINFMRGHKFRAKTSKEAKAKAKEKIDRYLDVAALSTTTDYEAKGIAYAIRYAIMRAGYEAKTFFPKAAPEDVIPLILEKYIPESAIRDIASRNPDYQYSQTSGAGGASQSEPKAEPQPEPKTEPKPRKPRKPRKKPEPKPEPVSEPVSEPASEPKPEPTPEPQSEPKAEPKSEPKTEPKSEPKTEPKQEPKREPQPEPQPETAEPTTQGQNNQAGKRVSKPEFTVHYSANAIDKFCQNTLETKRFSPSEYGSTVGIAVSNIIDYAEKLLENPTSDISEEQIKQAYKFHEFSGGRSKSELRSYLSQLLKSRGANVIVKMLQGFSKAAKAIVPDTSRTYLYEDPSVQMGGVKSHISAIGLAMASRKATKLLKDVATSQTVTPERAAKILSDVSNKMVDYAQGVLERYRATEQVPTQTAEAVIKNAATAPKGIAGWLDYLTNKGAPEDAPSNMGPHQLIPTMDKILRNVQKLTAIDMGGIRTDNEEPTPMEINRGTTKSQEKRGRGRPKKISMPEPPEELTAGVRAPKNASGRPKKGSENSPADEDFHERQLESAEFKDNLSPDEYDALSEEEQNAYTNNWIRNRGGAALPEFERRRKEWIDEQNSKKTDEELARRYAEYENDAKEVAAEKAEEGAKAKKSAAKKSRNSRNSNDERPITYARIRAPKPSVFFDGHKYLWNDKIGDYVWCFWGNNRRVVKKLIDAKIEKAKRLLAAKAELDKQPDDPASSFDVAKAYQGKRIWMGEDAQTIQDGSVVAVKLRRPATDEQFATLKNLGFSYNEESNGFVKAGEMTDADCDAMKTCRLMFSDEDKSGRNPNHIDQESYATLRARGVIGHIPEELRGGVPARENSQKHAKGEGTVGSSWETFERDGRTYFRSGRAPNSELVEQLKAANFFYDDISRVWSKEGSLEENDGVLKKLGLRWDEYADEDLTKKYLGIDLPRTDWEALVENPDALETELRNKYIVCNPDHVMATRTGTNEMYLDDSPKWDEDVSVALYDVLCPYENDAYNEKDPELVEIPLGDGTMLRFAVFDPCSLKPNEEGNDDGEVYSFRDSGDIIEGAARLLAEELIAVQKGESYSTDDPNGDEGYESTSEWRSYGYSNDGGWGSYAADHGIGDDYGDTFIELPPFEINSCNICAPNILDVFNKSVFFIDQSTLEKLRSAKPVAIGELANA